MQYAFAFDPSRCTQCFACEVACKAEHDLAPHVQEPPGAKGPRLRQVFALEAPGDDAPVEYVSMSCMHCGSPACMAACPTGAIHRDERFGAVLVDRDRCIGCRYCSWACEFGAPQFDRDGLMRKCDFCIERLAAGDQPACVAACCGGALLAGPVDEITARLRGKAAARLIRASKPEFVLYVRA